MNLPSLNRYLAGFSLLLTVLLAACATSTGVAPTPGNTAPAADSPTDSPTRPTQEAATPAPPVASPTGFLTPTPDEGIPQEQDALIPSLPPQAPVVTRQDGFIELEWSGTGSDIITHYTVYRRHSPADAWETIGFVPAEGENRGEYNFQDQTAEEGVPYQYALAAVDRYGKESVLSEVAGIGDTP